MSATAPTPESADRSTRRRPSAVWAETLATHRWFAGCAAVALLLFGTILTQGSGNLFTAEQFTDFYDHQAASLLQGRLDVPPEVITFEAFVHEGKSYGYFGLTPALLRLPFAAFHLGIGQLSRAYMLAYFAAMLVAGYLLLLEAGRRRAVPVPRPWIVVLFVANAGVANTAFFLGSRAYIYHEAILCGVAFALWGVWATLRYLDDPRARWWVAALVTGVLSLHARPPTGLFALTVLGLAAGWRAYRGWRDRATATPASGGLAGSLTVGLLAVLGVATFNGVSYLKFRTIEGCPLRLNVQYGTDRLARIDGKQFHLSNLPFSANAYLFQPYAQVSRYFPYVRPESPRPADFPGAKIDMVEPMLGLPFAMPGLLLAAGLGFLGLRAGAAKDRPALLVVWLGVLPVGLSMFAAIAVCHRYTADFVPFLIAAAAGGGAALGHATGRVRFAAGLGLGAATLVAVPLNLALTLQHQGENVWGVPDAVRARYAGLRAQVDRWFGVAHPAGYDVRKLPIRGIDASTLTWTAGVLAANPAKLAEAIALYRQVLGLTPADPVAHARLASALVTRGNLPEGIAAYQEAIRLAPGFAGAHHNLGVAYLQQRRLPEAVAEFQTALQLDPNLTVSRQSLESLGVRPAGGR